VTDDREIDFPETVDEAAGVLGDESFFVPTETLPDDPDALKEHIEELYLHLARASRGLEHYEESQQRRSDQLERKAEETQEKIRELRDRNEAVVDDLLGDSDDGGG